MVSSIKINIAIHYSMIIELSEEVTGECNEITITTEMGYT